MSRYIEADTLREQMYHEAFETDTKMQRWDSGCWIRYKLFENILEQQPTADVVKVVRCEKCTYSYIDPKNFNGYCRKRRDMIYANDFCSNGERREDG